MRCEVLLVLGSLQAVTEHQPPSLKPFANSLAHRRGTAAEGQAEQERTKSRLSGKAQSISNVAAPPAAGSASSRWCSASRPLQAPPAWLTMSASGLTSTTDTKGNTVVVPQRSNAVAIV